MLSVIIPVYNSVQYLEECVLSVMKQSYSDIEMVIIDDASTDGSFELCDVLAKKDSRIKVFHFSENKGVSAARNKGIEIAKGDYVTFLDSDDCLKTEYAEELINAIKKENADIVCCGIAEYRNGRLEKVQRSFKKSFKKDKLGFDCIYDAIISCRGLDDSAALNLTGAVCKVYRAEVIKKIRYNEKLHIGEDAIFFVDALKQADSFLFVNKILYKRRIHVASASYNKANEFYRESLKYLYGLCKEFLQTDKERNKYTKYVVCAEQQFFLWGIKRGLGVFSFRRIKPLKRELRAYKNRMPVQLTWNRSYEKKIVVFFIQTKCYYCYKLYACFETVIRRIVLWLKMVLHYDFGAEYWW